MAWECKCGSPMKPLLDALTRAMSIYRCPGCGRVYIQDSIAETKSWYTKEDLWPLNPESIS